MRLEWWRSPQTYSLEFPFTWINLLLTGIYIALFFWGLWRSRSDFQTLSRRQKLMLGLAAILVLPAQMTLLLSSTAATIPAAPIVVLPSVPMLSLTGAAIIVAAAVWLGPGPALLVGALGGWAWGWLQPLTFSDMLAFSVWGYVVAKFLQQPYRGKMFALLRQPLISLPLAAPVMLVFLSLSRLCTNLPVNGLLAIGYVTSIWQYELPLWLVGTLILGIGFQLLAFFFPYWPRRAANKIPAYNRSLRARFMLISIPLVVLSIVLSVLSVSLRAIQQSQRRALSEMQRSALSASSDIVHFYYTGLNLLSTFAENPALLDPQQQSYILEQDRQVVPFFQELLIVDSNFQVVNFVPQPDTSSAAPSSEVPPSLNLTTDEALTVRQALELSISLVTRVSKFPSGGYGMTVVQPIRAQQDNTGVPIAFLLGRVELSVNPEMGRALQSLQSAQGQGMGFIVDEWGQIIAHPDPNYILHPWEPNETAPKVPVPDTAPQNTSTTKGIAYKEMSPNGYPLLTYLLPVDGTLYTVVLQVPYATVLDAAAELAGPLLLVLLLTNALLLIMLPLLSARITQPLNTLSEAAQHIARGDLDYPVKTIKGEDEVAQLGSAFEQMRVRLKARLNDLSLLLRIAQNISVTLDLERGVPQVLQGALEETGARTVRFVLLGSKERILRVFASGDTNKTFAEWDRGFAQALTHRKEPLIIQDLSQTRIPMPSKSKLQSVAIFPVRSHGSTVAMLWVGSDKRYTFDEARINFLSTLANQASVLVENARLFQAAEGGRQRLSAILASTADAILVTDAEMRLLLFNPAAQHVLGLDEQNYGRPLQSSGVPKALIEALETPVGEEHQQALTVEVPMENGQTFYASIAPVLGSEGLSRGKVVVLRDVTHFKEMDEMKSDFVATVSHDLRAPLTFIRGYATMLMVVGELNDKQHEYLQRILEGIDQMGALISDLLNLRRIDTGVGIRQEPCQLGLILIEAVDTMRARATTKGITLRLEPSEGAPTVIGDRTLLRQAIGNLVDNAIKYTPAGGHVSVGLETTDTEAIIHVSDNGIGIAQENLVRLFEKFYRIKRRETGHIQGTGLGLALVKSIVERHGGRVWVESVLDQGSTFYIALPLPRDDEDEAEKS